MSTASSSPTTIYAYANTAYLLLSSITLLTTTLFTSPESKSATISQMVLSIFLLLFAAFNIPLFFPYTWAHWASILIYHTVVFVRHYTAEMAGPGLGFGGWAGVLGSGVLWVWGVGLLVFTGEGRRARSSYLFTPAEKRRLKVEKREARLEKLKGKRG